jgi:MoaA/NifB/PqqE/SkfB family radical SAM enzyme
MVRLCRERGIRTVFSTNATRLDRRMADAVFDSGLDQIVFAVNGTTPEVFEHYHRGACYAAVTRNIRGFLDRKRDRRSPIRVSVQMIRLPLTEPQIPEFYRQWRMPGVDAVRVKTDVVCLEGVCLESRRHRTPPRRPCPRLWMGPLYIEGNGDVYASPGVLYRAAPVGNLRQQPLAAIWNGDRLRAMRAAHAAGNLADLPECRACGYPKPQLPLILGAFLLDPFRTGRLVPRVERLGLSGRLPLYEDRDA